ncbi:hypothetical protein EDB81DRAFT_255287 [Dactylonectria macrodidyma]|uniref:Uncharacterized protein n=1 Tax=Dactylonectria macrodidyma TaxID=307937 RepID=A0A9P9FJV3_9HYPO|nr:hypothetical protein EDB81DRAFT_255287 [Dactylonectria macrodidyma]
MRLAHRHLVRVPTSHVSMSPLMPPNLLRSVETSRGDSTSAMNPRSGEDGMDPPAWPNSARFATRLVGDAAYRPTRASRDPTLSFTWGQERLTLTQTHPFSLSLFFCVCDLQHRDSRRGVRDHIVSRKAPTRLSPAGCLRGLTPPRRRQANRGASCHAGPPRFDRGWRTNGKYAFRSLFVRVGAECFVTHALSESRRRRRVVRVVSCTRRAQPMPNARDSARG